MVCMFVIFVLFYSFLGLLWVKCYLKTVSFIVLRALFCNTQIVFLLKVDLSTARIFFKSKATSVYLADLAGFVLC